MRIPCFAVLCSLLTLSVAPVFAAVSRTATIDAPGSVAAGAEVTITVAASTDDEGGEQIGFFHAQYSVDNGRTWTGFCFEEKMGSSATRSAHFTAGPAGSKAIVRLRVAFRGGSASDVDFTGAPIKWEGSWTNWQSPPAKIATIKVVAG